MSGDAGTAAAIPAPPDATAAAPSLAHLPLPLFAAPMGLGGLAFAWQAAGHGGLAPDAVGEALALLALAVFTLVTALFAAKAALHRAALAAELAHPVRGVFAAAATIATMIAGVLLMPWSRQAGGTLWAIGAVLHLVVAVMLLRRWLSHPVEVAHAAPTWLVPLVGNILAPLGAVKLGLAEIGWLYFGLGAGLWAFLMPILLNRLIFHPGLPARLVPSLAILLAPPSVGFLAWLALTGGGLDAPARLLFGLALFFALALLAMLPRFLALPWYVSWWAYTFPAAAFATASQRYAALVGGPVAQAGALMALAAASVIVAIVALRAMRAAPWLLLPEH
jgi:tellurite resistance protein